MVGSASWNSEKGNPLNLDAVLKLNYAMNSTIVTSLVTGILESLSSPTSLNYFEPISILAFVPSSNYVYTLVSEEVDKGCPGGINFPQNQSIGIQSGHFCSMPWRPINDFMLEYPNECVSWKNCTPLGPGIEYLPRVMSLSMMQCSEKEHKVRFSIGFGNNSYIGYSRPFDPTTMFVGEGSWDGNKNQLCMVACRILNSTNSLANARVGDCSLRLSLRHPAFWTIRDRTIINGQIWTNKTANESGRDYQGKHRSTTKKTDPLFFKHLSMSSIAFYTGEAKKSVWRMDLEITMVLISNTLACVFVGLQLFHVKKNPDVLPLTSLVMFMILTLGHMIPLVLNYEAMFFGIRNRQNVFLGDGGWVEVNEVIVRVVTMVAFLLQFRLLQLVWTARLGDENHKSLWIAEKKTLFVSLPSYIIGLLIVWLMNLGKNNHSNAIVSSSLHQQHSLWGALRSYGGLVLDGFLFPQILLNTFRFSKESPLSHSFYIGTTFVRLLPHAYDLYRAQNYARRHLDGSYFYANPSADFYSTSWDVIIPCGGVLFAAIIFLQQRFGGRCILPRRFREEEGYEKVPIVTSKQ
ncbi:hypothetical protein LOK49_LG07G03148 [Camellia lanceoleosa]|uniref:Uncharacterized protein n=1 Tax=Camellia lanceoleosa TaxID=1840588 RepID=A0ACC0H426_9ERIC|nr:hypothetical protein LOK49_LG07G03148 [Camellia lanceoleosa]